MDNSNTNMSLLCSTLAANIVMHKVQRENNTFLWIYLHPFGPIGESKVFKRRKQIIKLT